VGEVRARLAGQAATGRTPDGRQVADQGGPTSCELTRHVSAAVTASGRVLGVGDLAATVAGVRDHAWGLGPLQPLVDGPGVTDVLVNGPDSVWVDCGDGLRRVAVDLGGEQGVRALAVRLAAGAGRRLDESVPWVDARLPAGVRLHAVIPPVSPSGTHLSLRVLRSGRLDLEALVAGGCLHPAWCEVLQRLVTWHAAFLVTGGTGSGKTTLLAALLSLAPVQERLVLVEDVAELQPAHPHVVRLEARHANVEGRGGIGLEVLVRQALRMRPDRIVVGECRGPEVRDLLAALNTGHAGGCGTLHANAPAEVPARLEALGLLAGLGRDAVQAQAAAAFDAVVHLSRGPDGVRRVVEVAAVRAGRDGSVQVQMALRRNGSEQDGGRDGGKGDGGTGRGHDQGPGDGYVTGPGWPVLAARLGLAC
jgi:pilus assembly protein CpaF